MLHDFLITGILLLAGSGERFGNELPKQFHKLSGKKVYIHTLEKYCQSQIFDEIILVCHPQYTEMVEHDVADINSPPIRVIEGGRTRQESTYLGAMAAKGDYLVIHDAVRPFVSIDILKANAEAAIRYGAVDTCIPSNATFVHAPYKEMISTIPIRADYQRGQTPQSFKRDLLLKAHNATSNKNSTDDCRLVLEMGNPVHIVPGDESNIKITTMLDLFLAEQIFRLKGHNIPPGTGSLENKVFAITGGTSGIGKALVKKLSDEGATALALSRSSSDYPVDLTDEMQIERVFKAVETQNGKIDGLINSAGLLKIKNTNDLAFVEMDQQIKTNFSAVVQCCVKAPLKAGAHIVNLSSSSFYRGRPVYTLYSSMKAALVNFTQGFSKEHPE